MIRITARSGQRCPGCSSNQGCIRPNPPRWGLLYCRVPDPVVVPPDCSRCCRACNHWAADSSPVVYYHLVHPGQLRCRGRMAHDAWVPHHRRADFDCKPTGSDHRVRAIDLRSRFGSRVSARHRHRRCFDSRPAGCRMALARGWRTARFHGRRRGPQDSPMGRRTVPWNASVPRQTEWGCGEGPRWHKNRCHIGEQVACPLREMGHRHKGLRHKGLLSQAMPPCLRASPDRSSLVVA